MTEVYSSGYVYYTCPEGHETIQYYINKVFVTMECPVCKEVAEFTRTEPRGGKVCHQKK